MDERYAITHMHAAGFSNRRIAGQIGRHPGTIGRELKRNRDAWSGYHYESAQRLAQERRSQASRRYKLDVSPLGDRVRLHLLHRWSPQQIAGRLRRERGDDSSMRVSAETIYRWIYRRHQLGERWQEWLRRRHTRRRCRTPGERRLRGQIPGRVGIEQRPAVVQRRSRFGDWESDTLEGGKGTGVMVTHVERKSRYVRLGLLTDKRSITLTDATDRLLRDLPAMLRRTLTADNGKEFSDFAAIERRLKLRIYFANPHSPWERGTNENTNGLLRDWFPKGTDFRRLTAREVAQAQRMLNNRPRKCLDYRTPLEVLNALPGVALRS